MEPSLVMHQRREPQKGNMTGNMKGTQREPSFLAADHPSDPGAQKGNMKGANGSLDAEPRPTHPTREPRKKKNMKAAQPEPTFLAPSFFAAAHPTRCRGAVASSEVIVRMTFLNDVLFAPTRPPGVLRAGRELATTIQQESGIVPDRTHRTEPTAYGHHRVNEAEFFRVQSSRAISATSSVALTDVQHIMFIPKDGFLAITPSFTATIRFLILDLWQ
ncbi:hypothetical protein AK812_SmicGene42862 [Symbiodinium microadriaticum]|uniref:Uncharacterized protein n=1 Tax=Symbiodinium microadriaticum TaxID=2951 RepID=A0A1Q9C2G8_SYMMI|nr:hypothetical protein AK812_SmicGene42862 [Symbiodinium microadriaticum]